MHNLQDDKLTFGLAQIWVALNKDKTLTESFCQRICSIFNIMHVPGEKKLSVTVEPGIYIPENTDRILCRNAVSCTNMFVHAACVLWSCSV